jgi:hypothetical protein
VKRLLRLVGPLLVAAPLALAATSATPADAGSLGSDCSPTINECSVSESEGGGYCVVTAIQSDSAGNIDYSGEYAYASYINTGGTGYACRFWLERNVNDSGWYTVSGVTTIGSAGGQAHSYPYFNDGADGYQARGCFQYDWGSSLGAVHCSTYITYG